MTQKILLQIEIDDSQLDAAQAKVEKLMRSLEWAERKVSQSSLFDLDEIDKAQIRIDKILTAMASITDKLNELARLTQGGLKP